jgi:hypothetical protein
MINYKLPDKEPNFDRFVGVVAIVAAIFLLVASCAFPD